MSFHQQTNLTRCKFEDALDDASAFEDGDRVEGLTGQLVDRPTPSPEYTSHQGNALQILRDCVLLTRIGETAACSTRFHAIRGAPTKGLSVDVPRRNAYSVEAHRSTPISFYFISTECPRSSGVEPCCQSELNTSCGGRSPSLRAHS